MKAINKKHQGTMTKAIAWLIKYNDFNDQRNICDDNDDEKGFRKFDKKCESSYDKFLEYMDELPKREQVRIYKSELY